MMQKSLLANWTPRMALMRSIIMETKTRYQIPPLVDEESTSWDAEPTGEISWSAMDVSWMIENDCGLGWTHEMHGMDFKSF
jgi:hypothetical protein